MALNIGLWEFRVFWEWSWFEYVQVVDRDTDEVVLVAYYFGPLVIARHFMPTD